MKLTFDKGYEDYADSVHWLSRLEQLKAAVSGYTGDVIARMDHETLLCAMEDVEELMRYYCVDWDMKNLEDAMRKFHEMLQLCKRNHGESVRTLYLEMIFLRIDGMLYRSNSQYRRSIEGYERCVAVARKCVEAAKRSDLSGEQLLYVGWNCVECWKEATEVHDLALDISGAVQLMREVIPVMQWLEPDMEDFTGLCDQTSEFYAHIGTTLYQYGDPATGSSCLQHAYHLLSMQDRKLGSDFYLARAIWIRAVHGVMALMLEGDAQMLMRCETEANEFLRKRDCANLRDRTIVDAALSSVKLQRSSLLQQNGKLAEAIALAKEGVHGLKDALEILQEDYQDRQGYYRSVMLRITGRIYNSYLGAMESLGIMYFHHDDDTGAEALLKDVLKELTETDGLRMSGSGSSLIHAETLQYLSLISVNKGDAYQAEFYGTQAADMALNMGEETGNPFAWGVAAISCSLVAELALNMKKKPKALTYAEKGLAACDALEKQNPNSPQLNIRDNLQKFKRKASRKFF